MVKKIGIRILYIVIGVAALIYVLFSINNASLKTSFADEGAGTVTIEPTACYRVNSSTVEYILEIDNDSSYSRSLEFMSTHENVYVYGDGDIIFKRVNEEVTIFGRSPGTAVNIIELPVGVKTIEVYLFSPFGEEDVRDVDFYYGNGLNMLSSALKAGIIPGIISLFILFCGAVMLVFWFISVKRYKLNPAIFYFSVFTTLLGFWSLNETDAAMLLVNNRMSASIFGYLSLGIMIYPLLQFARNYLEMEKTKLFYFAVFVDLTGVVVLAALHIFKIADFKETAIFVHVMLFLAIIYVIYITVRQARRGISPKKIWANIIAATALLISLAINMYSYYSKELQTQISGKVGILIFILALGIETMIDSYDQINEGKRAEFYKNMAYNDPMTNFLNRSAFEKWEYEATSFANKGIVVFDLNNLKSCNDNLGHSFGDMYIIDAAQIIKSVFGPVGDCYRIGGDEFVCILNIRKRTANSIDYYIGKLRTAEKKYNDSSEKLLISIAAGFAKFDPAIDKDFEDTRARADKQMYEDKKTLKENN